MVRLTEPWDNQIVFRLLIKNKRDNINSKDRMKKVDYDGQSWISLIGAVCNR